MFMAAILTHRFVAAASTSASLATLLILSPARADEAQTAPQADRATACMIDVLKTVPGFVESHVTAVTEDREQLLAYTLREPSGHVVHRKVEVYEDGPENFSIYMPEGLTPQLFEAWRSCGVSTVQLPSP